MQTGKEVPLTHGEFGLLRAFVQRAGRVLSRDQLLQLLSGRDAEAYDRSIDMQIVRLRRKIEPDPKRPILIVTIPNSGYKFTARVRQVEAAASREPEPTASPARDHSCGWRTALRHRCRCRGARGAKEAACRVIRRSCAPSSMPGAATPRAVVARHEGVLAESRLREVLAYFGYPVAQEHAAERALHAALALAEHLPAGEMALPAGLAVRVGVASGLVHRRPGRRGAGRGAGGGGDGCRILRSRARSSSPQARGVWPAICSPIATSAGSLSGRRRSGAGVAGAWAQRARQPLRGAPRQRR